MISNWNLWSAWFIQKQFNAVRTEGFIRVVNKPFGLHSDELITTISEVSGHSSCGTAYFSVRRVQTINAKCLHYKCAGVFSAINYLHSVDKHKENCDILSYVWILTGIPPR